MDPWQVFMDKYAVGDVASVRIVKLMTFGALISSWAARRASSETERIEPTTRRRARLTSVMRSWTFWPFMAERSAPRGWPL